MDNESIEQWGELIYRVARNTARDFPNSEVQDLEQSLWVEVLEKLQENPELTPETQYIESTLYYAAKKVAFKERQQHLTVSEQYGYRTKDVRALLPDFFDRLVWYEAELPEEEIISTTFQGEYTLEDGTVVQRYVVDFDPMTRLDMMSDLSRAWDKLAPQYKKIIIEKFYCGDTVDSKRLSTAISRIADILNTPVKWEGEGPGHRHPITNIKAQAIVQHDYSGKSNATDRRRHRG